MERESKCDQPQHDVLRRWDAFWDNQLQRIKRYAEEEEDKTSTSSTANDKFRLDPGCSN